MTSQRSLAEAAYPPLHLFVAGEWIGGDRRTCGLVIDPTTGQTLGHHPIATEQDVERAVQAASTAFNTWSRTPAIERSRILRAAAAAIRSGRSSLAQLITLELGKPLPEALRETETACEMFEWAAEESRRVYGRTIPARSANLRLTTMQVPLGPVAAVSGWNAPAITPSRKLAAALAAGCTIILKPSEATPATAQFLVAALETSGVPPGVVNMVFGDAANVVGQLVDHPSIRVVSFTGGTEVGRQLAARAALTFKRTIFELGGHAPALIFEDVDVGPVARAAAAAKFRNTGQICTSPTRFLIARPIFKEFSEAFVAASHALVVGDPFNEAVSMGPLQNMRRLQAVTRLVEDAVYRGAKLLCGGEPHGGDGFFYSPTVLSDAPLAAAAMAEEPFGPLALLQPFDTVDKAIAEANRLPAALAGYAATNDLALADRVAASMQCGTLAINNWVASYAESPFGGMKDSGVGTEGGPEGIAAFLQTRFVSVATR